MAASKSKPKPEFLDSLGEASRARDQLHNIYNRRAKKLAKLNAKYDTEISEVTANLSDDAKEHLLKVGISKFDLGMYEDVSLVEEDEPEPMPETKPAPNAAIKVEYVTLEGEEGIFEFTVQKSLLALTGLELASATVSGPDGHLLAETVHAICPLLRGENVELEVNGALISAETIQRQAQLTSAN